MTPCRCITPLEFSDQPGHCARCGHTLHATTATTWTLAVAIAEIATGHRKLSDRTRPNTN
jgi:hypothetical protein